MFGFAFALVPLYDLLCEITGLGGKTGGQYEYNAALVEPDTDRVHQGELRHQYQRRHAVGVLE